VSSDCTQHILSKLHTKPRLPYSACTQNHFVFTLHTKHIYLCVFGCQQNILSSGCTHSIILLQWSCS